MPMDAALGKALLYGCMLRCASPLLTIAAALGHGRPMWVNPPPDKRSEAAAARLALAPQAYSQRSDHLAAVAAYNGWVAARAAGGRSAGAEFARQHFVSEQVLEAVAKGRLDYAATLAARGFLPDWYVSHLRTMQQQGPAASDCGSSSAPGADVYGGAAVAGGAPDEYSHNARIVKAAICAGFYPRILRVEAPIKYQAVAGGAMRMEADPASIKFFERGLGRVWVHPASVCFKAGSYPSGWRGRQRPGGKMQKRSQSCRLRSLYATTWTACQQWKLAVSKFAAAACVSICFSAVMYLPTGACATPAPTQTLR
eukprot:GHRQ01011407.1.p1 GENE.GHRQ01011407.1~~GHRQ01011407.1.p1  ORF type:complete len:312 (+),score=103.42 GHRQ01011407.1:429-1364(+)